MGNLDPGSSRAPYLQLADSLLKAIREGRYAPGDALPSYKALAAEYGVAVGTVQSALSTLRDQAVIITRHGAGSAVRADLDVATLPTSGSDSAGSPEVLRLLEEIRDRLAAIEKRLPAGG
jgi:DNA-binding GntR family transcriptional regulator